MQAKTKKPTTGASNGSFPAGYETRILDHLIRSSASPHCIAYVREAMANPTRNTNSGPRNLSGKYPSRKCGVTIGFESRTLELSCIHKLEYRDDVLLYLDQPPKLKVSFTSSAGRKKSFLQTPDFVAVKNDEVLIIECKRLEVLQARALQDPELYVIKSGRWTCPSAQADAERMGMRYEIWTEADFSYASVANINFLGDYLADSVDIAGYGSALTAMQRFLAVRTRSSITELLSTLRVEGVCADHLYLAIARDDVAIKLDGIPVSQHDACTVYRDQVALAAFDACERTRSPFLGCLPLVSFHRGAQIDWDGKPWTVLNVGANQVTLRNVEGLQSLPVREVQELVRQGLISSLAESVVDERHAAAMAIANAAAESELATANRRLALIEPHLSGVATVPKTRSIRRYLAIFRAALERYGIGYVGLIPRTAASGNRRARLRDDVLKVVSTTVDELYLTPTNISVKMLYGHIAERCSAAALPVPSYGWLCQLVNKIPPEVVGARREGRKGAYKYEPRVEAVELADATEPCRPFEQAHVDHTLLDLETVDGDFASGLGRVWITVMIDQFSRRVLGLQLTYAPPSYRSVLGVIRDCVRRFGRLPDKLVVDGGKEFRSGWFEATCAMFVVTIIRRPPAKPRYGSYIERYFGTLNSTLIYSLAGNTQLTKNVRQMTDEVSPRRHAVWTFAALCDVLERYVFETYTNLEHRGIMMTPYQRFMRGMEIAGFRPMRLIAYNRDFRILTCPTTPKGTAKVTRDGVKIKYFYYNAVAIQKRLGKSIPVRYDPEDMSRAYAQIDGAWVPLVARHTHELRYRTERDIALLTEEWRRRRSVVEKTRLTDAALIRFLKEVSQTEVLLKERRQAAQELALRQQRDPANFVQLEELGSGEAPAQRARPATGAMLEAALVESGDEDLVIDELEDF